MIMTGSNIVRHGKLKELNREDARRRPGGTVLRMTWKVYICAKKMHSLGINGESKLSRQPVYLSLPGK